MYCTDVFGDESGNVYEYDYISLFTKDNRRVNFGIGGIVDYLYNTLHTFYIRDGKLYKEGDAGITVLVGHYIVPYNVDMFDHDIFGSLYISEVMDKDILYHNILSIEDDDAKMNYILDLLNVSFNLNAFYMKQRICDKSKEKQNG